MRILVTGAGGYIAEALIPALQNAGHYVIPLVRWDREQHVRRCSLERAPQGASEQVWFADLAKGFGDLVNEQPPDTVIHLAGRVEISLLPNPKGADMPPVPGSCDIGALYRDNVLATANVLDYCLKVGVKHLVFASTQAVYGMADRNESSLMLTPDPLEHYAASKRAAEALLEMGRRQGLMVSVLRLPGVFGGDRKQGAVYSMCREALTKGEIHITHPYPIRMNVMHIEDVIAAFVAVVAWQPPNIYWTEGMTPDISGCEPCSLDILAEEIASMVRGCKVRRGVTEHPVLQFWDSHAAALDWRPKPRKERLAQLLEEIRNGT